MPDMNRTHLLLHYLPRWFKSGLASPPDPMWTRNRGSNVSGRRHLTMWQLTRTSSTQVILQPHPSAYRPDLRSARAHDCQCSLTVKRLVSENKLPHLLLYGPPGTGKTSTILAVARQIYGPSFSNMTLELNASDDRGIGVVRQQVQDFASTQTLFRCEWPSAVVAPCATSCMLPSTMIMQLHPD